MKTTTMRAALVLALLATASTARAAATEHVVDFCEGCDNGNLVLTMDGGTAQVFGLERDADTGHYLGVGKVSYNAQGVVIEDAAAQFLIDMVPSPTGTVTKPVDCTRATLLPSSIQVFGSKGAYVITSSDFSPDVSTPCARYSLTLTIDDHPSARGKLKRPFEQKRISISGRTVPATKK